jgi:hypothetical protein
MRVIAFGPAELRRLDPLPKGRSCDFCPIGTPTFRYPARDVSLGTIRYGTTVARGVSFGGWRACAECSALIEDGDWPALAHPQKPQPRSQPGRARYTSATADDIPRYT